MSWFREMLARFAGFIARHGRGRDRENALQDELRFHLDMMAEQLERGGLAPDEARREARMRLGGVTQVREAYAEQRTLPVLESLIQDARYGIRMLLRAPGFTLAALLTLGLGVGANTAIFSIVNAVLLRPLPYADPDRLVVLGDLEPDGQPSNIGFATFRDYQDRNQTLESIAVIRSWVPTLVAGGEAERLPAMRVSWNFFSMLGVRPQLGRDFQPSEDRPDRRRVVMLSDGLWRRRFGADRSIVGRTIRMNDVAFEVVGVMPPGLEPLISARFYTPAQIWAPVGYDVSEPSACRSCQHLKAIGRIREGVSLAQAIADLNGIRSQLRSQHAAEYSQGEMTVVPLARVIAGAVRTPLLVLLGAVGFVMLIACANVANLLLSRALNRFREIAVRAALGAGRGRLMRQLLTESLILALAGGVLGLTIASVSIRSVATIAPVSIPRLEHVAIDGWVLLFAFSASIVTGLGFGLVPALRGSSLRLRESLASDARTSTGAGSTRARQLLVVADLGLALVLLAGAGLMLRSVRGLMFADAGFNADGVLSAQFSLVGEAYREDPAVFAFQNRVLEKVKALPGVEAAALTGQIPMGNNYDTWGFHIEGLTRANPSEDPDVQRYSVSPDYFRTMGVPLRRGRLLTDSDVTNGLPVMVVSEAAAKLWQGADPIGRRVRVPGSSSPWRTVVGIVGDARHASLDEDERRSAGFYLPQAQVTDSFLVLVVKAATVDPAQLTHAIRVILKELDPAVPVYDVARLDDLVAKSYADRRFVMQLLGAFSLLALLLAAVGLYGVVSYSVAQRTREVGLRVALGAQPADVLRLVLGTGLSTVAVGIGVGLCAAFALTRLLRSLLYGVQATDPTSIFAAATALAIVAVVAHWLPARRALRVDPAIALRQE
jgi:putative ABC transport system permease protein